jgi:hypothetical protein
VSQDQNAERPWTLPSDGDVPGRTYDPMLVHLMSRWLVGMFQAMATDEAEWSHLEPYCSRIAAYLDTGPTIDIPNDQACIEAMMAMGEIVNAHSEGGGGGQGPLFPLPSRPS